MACGAGRDACCVATQMERSKTGETEIPVTGVFQRLYDVRNYTGVYAERFRSGDGRINSHADNRYVGGRLGERAERTRKLHTALSP